MTTATAADRPTTPFRLRLGVLVATALACLPYAALKLAWIAGSDVGTTNVAAARDMHETATVVANVLTLGLELAAVAVVAALTFSAGRRLPPLVVLGPMWVGTGLLAPIAVGMPAGLLVQLFAGGSPAPGDNGLYGWVFVVVYGGFITQAVLLVVAFMLYAASRWPWAFRERVHDISTGTTYALQNVITGLGLVGTGMYATSLLLTAVVDDRFGGPSGMESAAQRTIVLVSGVLPIAGALAVRTLVRRRSRGGLAGPLALAWIGSGVAFSAVLLPSKGLSGLESFVNSVGAISGAGLAMAGLLVLIDAHRPVEDPV